MSNPTIATQVSILFTVFTATHNRKELLPRLYLSLQNQTYNNFEWLIIDDGSIDGTEELVKEWKIDNKINIIYHWQKNRGKHTAINLITKFGRGELCVVIDSDDELLPNALERLKFHWDNINSNQKPTLAGISCLISNQYGKLIGNKFPKDYQIMDMVGMGLVNKIVGDKGVMLQMKALKMYRFPENLNNLVIGEGALWSQMAQDLKMCFINEILVVAWIEGRSDSLSLLSTKIKNYPGALYSHECFLNYNMRFFFKRPKLCMGEATRYTRLSLCLGISFSQQYFKLKPISAKLLWVLFIPLGFLFFIKDKCTHLG